MDKHLLTGTGMDHGGWLQSRELRFLKNADLPDSALSTHMLPTVHKTKAGPRGASRLRVHSWNLPCARLLRPSCARGLAPGQDPAEEAAARGTPLTPAGHLPSRSKASKPPLSLSSSTVLQDTRGAGALLIVCRWSREREASGMFWRCERFWF